MGVRMMAGAHAFMGLSVAFFALCAIALDPATFRQLQLQMGCAATAADAMEMRAGAVVLLLLAAAQAVTAMTAVVAPTRVGALLALLLSIPVAWRFTAVFAALDNVGIGRCHDHGGYHQALVACYAVVAFHAVVSVPSGLLLIASLTVL